MSDNNIDYQQKYLKYKSKYIELQNQIGGGKELRFGDYAILRLTIDITKIVKVELLYDGDTTDDNYYYYTIQKTVIQNEGAQSLHENAHKLSAQLTKGEQTTENKTDENYLVCTHNNRLKCFLNQYFSKFKSRSDKNEFFEIDNNNTMLSEYDIIEKKNIYIIIRNKNTHNTDYIKRCKDKISVYVPTVTKGKKHTAYFHQFNRLFASKLEISRETISNVISVPQVIFILPCIHELSYNPGKNRECDGNQKNILKTLKDSIFSDECLNKDFRQTIKDDNTHKCNYFSNIKIDWRLYDYFYYTRDSINNSSRHHCRKTNFVVLILESPNILNKIIKTSNTG